MIIAAMIGKPVSRIPEKYAQNLELRDVAWEKKYIHVTYGKGY